jgi:protein-S-isoprenylcysteine O-methyltransferase Ste14
MSEYKDYAQVRIFPPGVPIATILLGYVLNRMIPLDLGFSLPVPGRYWIGGLLAGAAFFGLGVWAVVLFRRGGQNENPWTPTPFIEQRGPFRITRNPMYLDMVLVCIGFAVMLMNWWILLLTPVGAWLLHRYAILPEEAYLERKFGDDYLAYKKRVRRWL